MRSFHIGISWSTGGAGGSGRVLETLTHYLPLEGVSVEGGAMSPPDIAMQTNGRLNLMAPTNSGTLRRFTAGRSMLQAALSKRPDVLASHFALYALPILDELRRQAFVVHFHGPWADESKAQGAGAFGAAVRHRIERAVYKRADRLITLSSAFANVLVEQYGVERTRVRIVPGAVDLQRFGEPASKQAARAILGWPRDRPVLLSVRRLVPRMGLENLVRSIAEVRNESPDVILYIAGKGVLAQRLKELLKELGLEKHVVLLGFVTDELLPHLYQAADLNIVPTLSLEGFGLVAAEALASGTPSLVTPIGGLPEVVAELSPSLILRSPEVRDLTMGICDALAGRMHLPGSAACRAYAEKYFSPQNMAERVAAVYREVC